MPASPHFTSRPDRGIRANRKAAGFSLIEVVVATGICTYALLVVASLLPVGLVSIRSANQQVTQTEIFNQIWSEVNATPYANILSYPRLTSGATYYDVNGTETTKAAAVFTVVCTQPTMTLPDASGGSYPANELNAVKVQIGFHVDPTAVAATDSRVTTRTFVIARRDGSLTSVPNGW